ncbi:hypothetical protein IEO21_09867 [Rhodonia placenta]|uniref:Protein-S-isoprenylcysteine O-methyltransferase n=2 Tax=Rhodonia placenta TaxID=104341 RepID=A0A8H7NTP3_9APHY
MSLTKIPAIVAATLGAYTTVNPPQPQVPPAERPQTVGTYEQIFSSTSKVHAQVLRYSLCSAGLLEIAVILARNYPSHPFSQQILRVLVRGSAILASRARFTRSFVVGCALATLGGLLRMYCYRTLGRFFTFEVSIRDNHRLVTEGPYAYVRHPSYTAWIATMIGLGICHGCPGSWMRESGLLDTVAGKTVMGLYALSISSVTIGFLRRAPLEDALLKREFGKEWEQWSKRVPYRMIPFVW